MTEELAEAVFHSRHRVLGRKLRPFTYWHAWVLDFAESPYVGHDGGFTVAEILFAVEVLSRPPSVPGDNIVLPRSSGWRHSRMVKRVLREGIQNVHARLLCYFDDFKAAPTYWRAHDSKAVKSDAILYAVANLMRNGGMSHREAWATTTGYGDHLTGALAEAGGHEIKIVTEAEREALKEAGY